MAHQIKIIFDGVNTNLFRPSQTRSRPLLSLQSGTNGEVIQIPESVPLLTYATRGMEPARFPDLCAAAFAQTNSEFTCFSGWQRSYRL